MQIRSENDLKLAYETINSFKEILPMAQKTDAALEYIKELKRDIRGFFRKEKEKLQRRLVKDNGIDGYIVLMQLPSFLNSKEDAAVYFEENEVMTCRPASLEEATQQVHERMELQAEVAAETKEESDTPFVQRWAEAKGMTVQELEQETGWTAEQLEQNIIDSSRIITTELVKAQRLMKILMTNNGRRRKGIPMVRRQQLLRAERNQRRRRSENRKES